MASASLTVHRLLGRDWKMWKLLKNRKWWGPMLREKQNRGRDKRKEIGLWG